MKYLYLRNVKLSVLSFALLGGIANAQVFEISNGDTGPVTYASKVNNDGLVLLKTNKANYTWAEQQGLKMIDSLSNDSLIPGNPSLSANGSVYALAATNPQNNQVEAATYNPVAKQYDFIGGMGAAIDGNTTAPFAISADDTAIVGDGWINNMNMNAFKWTAATGLVNLGSSIAERNTRANGISADSSTVVGWQEM